MENSSQDVISDPGPLPFDEPHPPPPTIMETAPGGRGARKKRPTWKILERLPAPPTPIASTSANPDPAPAPSLPEPSAEGMPLKIIKTLPNIFNIVREYFGQPSHNPDNRLSLELLSDIPGTEPLQPIATGSRIPSFDAPRLTSEHIFPNFTIASLMNWQWTGSAMKSIEEMVALLDILKSDEFDKSHLEGFDIRKETARLDGSLAFEESTSCEGWRESDVTIQVPDGKRREGPNQEPLAQFTFPGLHHQSLTAVIHAAFEDNSSKNFHYTLFKSIWRPSSSTYFQQSASAAETAEERIYDEIYSSDAMIEEHTRLQNSPAEPGCKLERIVAAMMFWSDSTHLAQFSTASLWPVYLYFGNQSKWLRGKPRAASCHHVAYIPKVPSFKHGFMQRANYD